MESSVLFLPSCKGTANCRKEKYEYSYIQCVLWAERPEAQLQDPGPQPLTSCVWQGKPLDISVPQFPNLWITILFSWVFDVDYTCLHFCISDSGFAVTISWKLFCKLSVEYPPPSSSVLSVESLLWWLSEWKWINKTASAGSRVRELLAQSCLTNPKSLKLWGWMKRFLSILHAEGTDLGTKGLLSKEDKKIFQMYFLKQLYNTWWCGLEETGTHSVYE